MKLGKAGNYSIQAHLSLSMLPIGKQLKPLPKSMTSILLNLDLSYDILCDYVYKV